MHQGNAKSVYGISRSSKICAVLTLLWLVTLAVFGMMRGSDFPYEMWLLLGLAGIWGGAAMFRAITLPPRREGA